MRRRNLLQLASGGIVIITGCLGDENDPEPPSDNEVNDVEPPADDGSDEGEPLDDEETQPNDESDDDEEESQSDPAPEPTFTVSKNDESSDYEELQAAYRVSEDGDVIGIDEGTYSVHLGGKSVVFVGSGHDTTTMRIESDAFDERPHSLSATNYWNLELQGERIYSRDELKLRNVHWKANLGVDNPGRRQEVNAIDCIFNPSNDVNPSNNMIIGDSASNVYIESCIFEKSVDLRLRGYSGPRLKDCNFKGGVEFDCSISEGISAENCMFKGFMWSSGSVEDSVFRPFSNENIAIHVVDPGFSHIDNSTILGKVKFNSASTDSRVRPERIAGCEFRNPGGVTNYFEGVVPRELYGNVFLDGDLYIDMSTEAYHEGQEFGNYYSEWDGGEDEDGNGIIDLPRPIPGEGDATDRYPLADPEPRPP